MPFEYVDVETAIDRAGLRMVVVGQVPSPWGEAAKGFFHLKNLPWTAVRLAYDDERLARWVGQELSGPVAIYQAESPRAGWQEILLLAERLAPEPRLLPPDPALRARALVLSNDLCSPVGLGWNRRLQMVHAGLQKSGGFNERVAGYLGRKYGYSPADAARYGPRVRELLGRFATELRKAQEGGSDYYLGSLSAVDVYSAAFMGLFAPLPDETCRMHPGARAAFEWLDDETRAALDPVLLAHRDLMYARHLETPLSL